MMKPIAEIKHSDTGEYYELYIYGRLMGTYDTAVEAANDFEQMMKEEAEND